MLFLSRSDHLISLIECQDRMFLQVGVLVFNGQIVSDNIINQKDLQFWFTNDVETWTGSRLAQNFQKSSQRLSLARVWLTVLHRPQW